MTLTKTQKIGVVGGCMFIFSILYATVILPAVVDMVVKKKVALGPNYFMRNIWSKFPFSMDFSFYMFNVTNPDGIKNGEKPILQEIGPYVYDEWHEKINQVDYKEDDTVSSNVKNTYFFNAEKSNGLTGDEEIIFPNVFILGVINIILRDKPTAAPIAGKAIDSVFKKPDSIFMKVKVKDLLFGNGLIVDCTNIKDFAGSAICNDLQMKYSDYGMIQLEEKLYSLSFWGKMNGTASSANMRVHRGLKNLRDLGAVVEYDNKPNISTWDDEYCDKFEGTDGTVFHPYFDKKGKDPLIAFNPGLCRPVRCFYHSKSEFGGMKTLRYTTDLGTDGDNNPAEKCYCFEPDKCLKKGGYDLFKCANLPLVVTNPHFYNADPWYLSKVEGLQPKEEDHMIIIDIDPFTGVPMFAHSRAQFNMFITKVEKLKLLKNFPEIALLPLFYIDENFNLPDFLFKELKNGHTLHKIGVIFEYLLMFGGLGMIGYASYKLCRPTKEPSKLDTNKTTTLKSNNSAQKKQMNISTLQSAQVPPNID